MNATAKFLIVCYIIVFVITAFFNVPYVEYVYNNGDLVFTGERGITALFYFNELTEQGKEQYKTMTAYYIDIQFLLVELLILTVIFGGLYKIFK